MSMDQFLAEHYGTAATTKTASAEDLEKQASVELFCKLAGEQNIDLKSMTEPQVQELYDSWVKKANATAAAPGTPAATTKTAEEEKAEKGKETREKAEKEHEEKKAAAEKLAEADFLGRTMAHAYVNELKKIAEANAAPPAAAAPVAVKVAEMPEAFRKHLEGKKEEGKEGKPEEKKEEKEEKKHHEEKEASAVDQLAFVRAKEMAKEAGFDPELAGRRIAASFTLGLVQDGVKSASAPTVDAAVEIRALELLENVGFPVTWT